jgi:hypothetical protein
MSKGKDVLDDTSTITIRVIDPYKRIDEARSRGDYFSAFALAVNFFEYYALGILEMHFSQKIAGERFERLGAKDKTLLLFCSGIIDQPIHTKMMEVIKERNRLIHPQIKDRYEVNPAKADKLLDKAKECIKFLKGNPWVFIRGTER